MIRLFIPVCAGLMFAALPAMASVSTGVQKWQAGDWNGAIAEWQTPAARGDADALFNLGQAYRLGRGVAQNSETALEYYRRAADKGHLAATANLGITLFQLGRRNEAMVHLRNAADKGDFRASYVMGIATFNGDGAARNPVMGYAYMIRARQGGMTQADQQSARMATLLSPPERARAEAVAAALEAGEPVPVELLSPGGRPPVEPVQQAATEPESEDSAEDSSAKADAPKPVARVAAREKAVAAKADAPKGDDKARADEKASADTGPASGWRVQLGAYANERAARSAWAALVSQSASLLEGQKPVYSPRGGLVRLQVGAFDAQTDAKGLCAKIAAKGRPCFVTKS